MKNEIFFLTRQEEEFYANPYIHRVVDDINNYRTFSMQWHDIAREEASFVEDLTAPHKFAGKALP